MAQLTVRTISTSDTGNDGQNPVVQVDNGNLWMGISRFATHKFEFLYSANKGQTWNYVSGSDISFIGAAHVTLDTIGDNVWAMVSDAYNGYFYGYIYHGKLDAGRTAITWDCSINFWSGGSSYNIGGGGIRAHAEGSGYKVHAYYGASNYGANYARFSCNSSGDLTGTDTNTNMYAVNQAPVCKMELDPVTKDIFMFALVRFDYSYQYIYAIKKAYTSATWPTTYGPTNLNTATLTYGEVATAWDGNRTVVAFQGDGNTSTPIVYDVSKTDLTVTARTPPSGVSGSMGIVTQIAVRVDGNDNIIMVWNDRGTDVTDLYKNVYTRAAGTWAGATLVRDTTPNTDLVHLRFARDTQNLFFMGSS